MIACLPPGNHSQSPSVPCLSLQKKQKAALKGGSRGKSGPLQTLAELLAPVQPGEVPRVGTLQATVAGVGGGGRRGIGRVRHCRLQGQAAHRAAQLPTTLSSL